MCLEKKRKMYRRTTFGYPKMTSLFRPLMIVLLVAHALSIDESKDKKSFGTVIGIDLGTTYSCVGVLRDGRVEIIPNDQGNRITPSCVAFTPDGERLVGDAAKNQLTSNPANTLFDAKRFIGRKWSDPTVQADIKFYSFEIFEKHDRPYFKVNTKRGARVFSPEEVSGMVLSKMKETAEAYLGTKVTHAVVTVPAYFNDAQRQATEDAASIAGLKVLRIINEPTAAAVGFGINVDWLAGDGWISTQKPDKNILVYDLGGGTFDVSLLNIDKGVFEVLSKNGNTHLGGEDFDQRVMEYFIERYKKKTGRDVRSDKRALQKLRREVEKTKRTLSTAHETRVEVESFYKGEDFSDTLTRAKFEELNMDLFRSTMELVEKVLDDDYMAIKDVHEVVLVGGSTRIPKIQQLVKEFFNGKEPTRGIHPDEAVAYGAAVQAGMLAGDKSAGNFVLLDVSALSLGLESEGGVFSKLIPRNSVIPVKKTQIYSTARDNQESVAIDVYEGEREMTKDNRLLGSYGLTGIPPAPKGVPNIEVTFEINVNGILKVSAEDKVTGNKKKFTVTRDHSRLSQDEIMKMALEAEKYSEEDRRMKKKILARNDLESYIYTTKHHLNDKEKIAGRISAQDKEMIETLIESAIKWVEKNQYASVHEFNTEKKHIEDIVTAVFSKLYFQEEAQPKIRLKDIEDEL